MRALLVLVLTGCGTPVFTSAIRSPQPWPAEVRVESKCVYLSDPYSGGNMDAMNRNLSLENWRLVYVSHYTSTKTLHYPTIFCFERPLVATLVPPPLQ